MKQQEVFKKIGGIIKELNDQYEYLKTVDGQINELELELFIANSHFLTDHVIILGKLNSQMSEAPKPVADVPREEAPGINPAPVAPAEAWHEEKYFEPLVQAATPVAKNKNAATFADENDDDLSPEGKGIDLGTSNENESFSLVREEPDTIRHELILDDADWDDDEHGDHAEVEDIIGEEIEIPPAPERAAPKIEADKPVADANAVKIEEAPEEKIITVNQKMSAQLGEKTVIGEQLSAQTISDLKAAITLNDKMLFVKDLFNGYSLAYSEAVEILNRFSSFNEADLFLKKNYVVKNNWEGKPATSEKFYALLKRRYA